MVKPSQQPPKNRRGKKRRQTQTPLSSEARAARLSEIKELIKSDRLDEALAALKPILKERPNNLRAKLMLANLLQKKMDFSAAIAVYEAIISLDRQKVPAYLELAECLAQLGKTKDAIAVLERVLSFCPENIQLLQALGDLSRQIPDRQALDYYRQVLAIAPNNLQANLALAVELRDSGLFTAAEQQLKIARQDCDGHLAILLEFAQLEKKRHQLERAWDYLQQASTSYPENIEPRLAAIEILCGLGRITEARQILEQLQQEPHPSIPLYFGHLEKKQGRREKALEWFELAVAKSPNLTRKFRAQTLVIEELKELGRFEEAIAAIDSLIQQFPHRIHFQLIKGSILQKKLAFSSAARLYRQILETESDCVEARIELAKTYSCLGRVEKAVKLLQDEGLQSSHVRVLMLLGALARASEDWSTASNYYQKACELEPYNINSHCALANLMFLQGEIDSAIDLLKTAQERMPYALKIALKQSELYLRWGDLDSSYDCLAKMRQLFPKQILLLWQLCRVYSARGNYEAAERVLAEVITDERDRIAETEKLRADIAFHQYDYLKAEAHFCRAIANSDVPTVERTKLASVLMLTYRIDLAREQLKLATTEFSLKTPTGKSIVPLKSHSAMVINALRIHPPLREQLEATRELTNSDLLLALAKIITQEPFYLGGCLYLAKELRHQGIFARIRDSLALDEKSPSIPQRIVQFWDELEPPESVQRICQSWRDRNPDYEYIRFSLPTALEFLQQHYDKRVLQAFDRCDQPATQADFFRLAYLNQMGGFYADVDDLCRASLNSYNQLNPELVVLQEDLACFGNNFLGCVPGQPMIRLAFERAIDNLLEYYNDGPWFDTGPGLLTCAVMNGLLPYLRDEQRCPRLWVLTQAELKAVVVSHISLPYKRTAKGWHYDTYRRWIELGEQPDSDFAA